MSIWQNYSKGERVVMLQQTAVREHLPQAAIEKDWWVTVVLKALFMTDAAPAMLFKGGTSLSKGWHLIERLSEDVDIAIDHSFFGVNGTNKSQRDKLRKKARAYIVEELSVQLDEKMKELDLLYDLCQLMDTKYGCEALKDNALYEEIVKHRETYYSLKYVDYERHSPELIDFVPPVSQREDWGRDYDNMLLSFIYGKAPSFTTLLKRMEELRERFRKINKNN